MITSDTLSSLVKMESGNWRDFGSWLQDQRERAEVSQSDLAKKIDLSIVHLSRIENGHSGVKRSTVIDIVNGINMSTSGHVVDLGEALTRAGFAFEIEQSPQTLVELLERLERLGVENLHFANHDALRYATPDELQEVLDAVQVAIRVTMERQQKYGLSRNTEQPP